MKTPNTLARELEALDRIGGLSTGARAAGPARPRGVRLWVRYRNSGAVRITVPTTGRTVMVTHGYHNGEGWTSETLLYSCDGRTLRAEVDYYARDCDGRMDRQWTVECPVEERAAIEWDDTPGVAWPRWNETRYTQRDHAAEAAGY